MAIDHALFPAKCTRELFVFLREFWELIVGRECLLGCFGTDTPQPQFTEVAQVHRGRGCQDTYSWVSTKVDQKAAQPTGSFSGLPEDPSFLCGLRKPPGSCPAPPSPRKPVLKVWGHWAARLGGQEKLGPCLQLRSKMRSFDLFLGDPGSSVRHPSVAPGVSSSASEALTFAIEKT